MASALPVPIAPEPPVGALDRFGPVRPGPSDAGPLRERVRELEQQLERADALATLGQMAAELAHEIRHPLSAIEGFASLLVRDLEAGDRRRQFAQRIVAGARRLNELVADMLLFARPCVPRPLRMALAPILEEALAFLAEECRHQGRDRIVLRRDLAPEADTVEADPDLLRQAVLNLLLNAVQAMPEGGEIRVVTRAVADRIEIRIEDTGPGIPREVRDRVPEPFFTTKATGTGLGLAIVRRIVRLHGGELRLESQEGRGTAAIVALPRGG
jgi:signal transduction histidine kinase